MSTLVDREIHTFTKRTLTVPDPLAVLADGQQVGQDCGVFRVMSQKDGDKRVIWNRRSIPEIHAAKKMFDDLIKEGMVPYKVGVDGKATSQVMAEFDASAEEVIFMPVQAIAGG